MPSVNHLLSTICDHLLRLVPDPAESKRLDDIVEPDEQTPRPLAASAEASDPRSSVRPSKRARRAAS